MFDVLLKLSWHTKSLSTLNYIVKSFWMSPFPGKQSLIRQDSLTEEESPQLAEWIL